MRCQRRLMNSRGGADSYCLDYACVSMRDRRIAWISDTMFHSWNTSGVYTFLNAMQEINTFSIHVKA